MTTRMPAARHSATAAGTWGRTGSARPSRPMNSKSKSCSVAGQAWPSKRTARHRQHAQPLGGQCVDGAGDARLLRIVEVAQIHHRFRRTLGGHRLGAVGRCRPHMRHRAQLRAERVGLHQTPVVVQVFGVGQEALAELMEGLFHRVEGIDHAGQDRHFHQGVEGLGQLAVGQRVQGQAILRARRRRRPGASPSCGSRSGCRSCRCTAPWWRPASRWR